MKNYNLHFLNHTCFLIEHEEWLLLLDPWPTSAISFDGWLSNPPCFLNDKILSAFINGYNASNKNKLGILVSHGHDDHCDDSFLKSLSPNIEFFIPKYNSLGVKKRISSSGFNNIREIPTAAKSQIEFGPFKITASLANFTAEHDDDNAVIGIFTDKYSFIHANDCSIPFPNYLIDQLKDDVKGSPIKYFASQTNRANCWPHNYPQIKEDLSEGEFDNLVKKSITKTIQSALDNANHINADHFISYGGYTAAIPLLQQNPPSKQFLPTPNNIRELDLNYQNIKLCEAVPGDTIETLTSLVNKPFWTRLSSLETISQHFLDNYANTKHEILPTKYYREDMMSEKILFESIMSYMEMFNEFLLRNFEGKLPKDLIDKTFRITVNDLNKSITIKLGDKILKNGQEVKHPNKEMVIDTAQARALVTGKMNFESFYVGFNGIFKRNPVDVHNVTLIGFLQKFAYVYQKRLVPDSLKQLA